MNDDDLSELILRASAYLDGELDAAEMARAEADPAVMAEVAALRELQDAVRDVEPAPADARESAIAAALAEFDAHNEAHVPVPPAEDEPLHLHRPHAPHAPVVPFRPRPAYTRWLTAAAAVVGVGLLGVVVVNGGGGSDDESSVPEAALDATSATEAGRAVAEAEGTFAETAEASAAEMAAGDAAAAPEIAAAEESMTLAAPATTAAAAAEAFGTTAPTAAFPPFDPERPILGVEELAAVGAELLAGEAAGTIARDVETRCELAPFEPYKRGLYDDGTGAREVVIAIEPTTLQTGAFDADTCTVVTVTPLP